MISKKNSKKRGKRILKSKKRITGGFPKDTLSLWTWNLGMFLIKKHKKNNEKSSYWIELNVDDGPDGWKRKFDVPYSSFRPTYIEYNLPYYYKEEEEPEEKYLASDGRENGMFRELGYRSNFVEINFKSGIYKMEVNPTMRDGSTPTWAYSMGGYYYFYNVIRPLEKTTKEEHDTLLKTYMKIVNNDTADKVTDEEKKQFEHHMEALSKQPEPKQTKLVPPLSDTGKFRFVAKFFFTRNNKFFYIKPRYRFIFNIIKLSKNVPTEFKELYELILNAEKDVNGFFTKIGRATKEYHIWTSCGAIDRWEGMCSWDY